MSWSYCIFFILLICKLPGCSDFTPNLYIIFSLFLSFPFACIHSVLLTTLLMLQCLYYVNKGILDLICKFLRFLCISSLRILTANYFFLVIFPKKGLCSENEIQHIHSFYFFWNYICNIRIFFSLLMFDRILAWNFLYRMFLKIELPY